MEMGSHNGIGSVIASDRVSPGDPVGGRTYVLPMKLAEDLCNSGCGMNHCGKGQMICIGSGLTIS